MSWRRSVFALAALFLAGGLSACGFQPLYGTQADSPARSPLAGISVDPIPGREGQVLTKALEDRFDPLPAPDQKIRYGLAITLSTEKVPVVVEPDGTISRYNMVLSSNFRLYDKGTGQQVYAGPMRRISSYNVSRSDFSTFIGERDALERGLVELAEDYRMRLAAFLKGHGS